MSARRWLITGAAGFVGARLVRRLAARPGVRVHGLVRGEIPAEWADWPVTWHRADLERPREVAAAVRAADPERVVHLGAAANPRACERDPARAYAVNAGGTAAVLSALEGSGARALLASSAAVYGPRAGRLGEALPLSPRGAYGRSKRAAEQVAEHFAARGLGVVIARSFNHTGLGQSEDYVLAALAANLRRALANGTPLAHGNLFPRRDFLHVEDVLDAYELLLERGLAGRAYNVASGVGRSIGDWLEGLMERLGRPQSTALDPSRARPDDPLEIVGDPQALQSLGWSCTWDTDAILDELAGARPPRL